MQHQKPFLGIVQINDADFVQLHQGLDKEVKAGSKLSTGGSAVCSGLVGLKPERSHQEQGSIALLFLDRVYWPVTGRSLRGRSDEEKQSPTTPLPNCAELGRTTRTVAWTLMLASRCAANPGGGWRASRAALTYWRP